MLKKLFDEYISEVEYSGGLRFETIRSYKQVFTTFCKIMPEITRPDHLTVESINLFFKRLKTRTRIIGKEIRKTGINNSTVKTYGSKLRVFFEWLVQRNHLKENPIKLMKLPEPIYDDARALDRDSVQRILTAIVSIPQKSLILKRDLLMFHIFLLSGLRKGELLGLRVIDIDAQKELMTVRGETSKSKKTKILPVHPTIMMYFHDYMKERNQQGYKTPNLFVSANKDEGLTEHGLKHWVEKLKERSGVRFHLHRFRHTFATNLGNGNTSLIKIQKLLGHASPRMTQVYLRSMSAEDSREEISKLSIDSLL